MILESALAYLHILAILAVVVFLTSEAALCRPEWVNAAVVRRLVRVDVLYLVAAVVLLATGLARAWFGIKGAAWYWAQPLLHLKLTLFVVIGLLSIKPTRAFLRWQRQLDANGTLPAAEEIRATRRRVMIEAHLLILVPLFGVLMARGIGVR